MIEVPPLMPLALKWGVLQGAYNETAGIEPEYQNRRDLYNLYYLLNHLNLFGGSYLQAVLSIIRKNS